MTPFADFMRQAMLPLILATSLVPALVIMLLPEERRGFRTVLNIAAAVFKLLLMLVVVWGVLNGISYEVRYVLMPGASFIFRADPLAVMFAGLSALLWLFTTVYAIGYMEGAPDRSRFFGFFGLCVASTMGIAFAGNLMTFLLFYEMLTLSTYPLVVHRGTEKALRAGRTYLFYTIGGGAVLLLGIALLHSIASDIEFRDLGGVDALVATHRDSLRFIFLLLIAGVGVKAALVPLHGWLPVAMVAPAPVSALLHAVAVVKAGAFGIIRIVYNVYGIETAEALQLLAPLAVAASFTILYGSVRALVQDEIKKRLAFSTVSQVSYIALGVSLFGPIGTIGGVVHLVHQGLMKITLFFCAGNYAETLGIHHVHELDGAGKRMPLTSSAFTVGAFGMIGLPPIAGFIAKWYLGTGAMAAGMPWVIPVLVASTLLNAAYFLPLVHRIWFRTQRGDWPSEQHYGSRETSPWLLWPAIATAAFSVAVGLWARFPFSPLRWAEFLAARMYSS